MKKYRFMISGLDCANCANRIEETLSKEEKLDHVNVNFNTLKLSLESDLPNVEQFVQNILDQTEPGVMIRNETSVQTTTTSWVPLLRLLLGIMLILITYFVPMNDIYKEMIIIIVYVVLLSRTFMNACLLFIKNKTINENLLITISCVGAYFVGEHMEGLMVIILYEIGKILEDKAVNKSRRSIQELMNIQPEYANVKNGDRYDRKDPHDVHVGDIILVKVGEKIPLDGVVLTGSSSLDLKALTGEALPALVKEGSCVLSGSINLENVLEIVVKEEYQNSTVTRILELVENATDKKSKTETFVARMSKIYTPVVLLLAIITAVVLPIVSTVTYSESIYKALIFLVISCPCAIAISVPLSYFSAIGASSKEGILIKGSNFIDALCHMNKIVFDKTGTLTTGNFKVTKIVSLSQYSQADILDFVAKGEKFSTHPIAISILKEITYHLEVGQVKNFKEVLGRGITYTLNHHQYMVGNQEFVGYQGKTDESGVTLFLKEDDHMIGSILLTDEVKVEASLVIEELNRYGINSYMLTGDNQAHTKYVAAKLHLKHFIANMLPDDKYKEIEKMILDSDHHEKVAFVGDGINDAPVLALADIGISMGGVGSSSAIEASDIVIMNDDLTKIIQSLKIAKKTNRIIKQNLIFAFGTKIIILVLSIFGIAEMWQAIFADVGVTLLTILNTLRILKKN